MATLNNLLTLTKPFSFVPTFIRSHPTAQFHQRDYILSAMALRINVVQLSSKAISTKNALPAALIRK
jgi:hypothetical protein